MAISGITSGMSGYLADTQNPYQAVKTTYGQLQQNLSAGNVAGVPQVYAALVKAIKASPIGQVGGSGYNAVQQSLAGVAQALQSGSPDGIQAALVSLGNNINAAALAAGTPPTTAPTPLTPAQMTATLMSEIAGSGSGGGTDPLLTALNGGNGGDSTSSDPLLAALSSGVNIVV